MKTTNFKRSMTAFAVATLIAITPIYLLAQRGPGYGNTGKNNLEYGQGRGDCTANIPNLTEDQEGKIKKLKTTHMKEMQKYERCMAKIQQSQFVDIQRRQEKFVEEVGPLCKSGNRGKAQKLAIQFGKDMSKHPAIVEITKCSKLLTSTMAKDELDDMDFNYESSDVHVCDEIDEMQQ